MNRSLKLFIFAVIDLCCILLALTLGAPLTRESGLSIIHDYTGASFFTGLLYIASYYTLDCYPLSRRQETDLVPRVVLATFIGTILTGFTFYTLDVWKFPRLLYIIQLALTLAFAIAWRSLYLKFHARFKTVDRIILYGPGPYDNVIDFIFENNPDAEILGYINTDLDPEAEGSASYLGQPEDIITIASSKKATSILIMPDIIPDGAEAHQLLTARLVWGFQVEPSSAFVEREIYRVPVEQIRDSFLLLEYGFSLNEQITMRRVKRLMDIFTSVFLIIATSPISLITALAIRFESKGPVIYKQDRVGLNNKEFTLFKFRSMATDAEKNGAVWAMENDPRVTRIGKIIRKFRIDELPQLINVLRGDMSLIGPRPERMQFVKRLEEKIPYYYLRHTVKPGMTGWAQVSYPYGASERDSQIKLEYDLYYIKHISLLFECKIILKTIGVILFPSGAR